MSIKSIITDYSQLRKPCEPVLDKEDISSLIQDLKDTLIAKRGLGLSANQIGVNKKVCFIRIPTKLNDKKEIEFSETLLINPRITHKDGKIVVKGEGCLSFPGITITTDRYNFVVIEYENEKREVGTIIGQGLQATVLLHELDHLNGITLLERKHKAK